MAGKVVVMGLRVTAKVSACAECGKSPLSRLNTRGVCCRCAKRTRRRCRRCFRVPPTPGRVRCTACAEFDAQVARRAREKAAAGVSVEAVLRAARVETLAAMADQGLPLFTRPRGREV